MHEAQVEGPISREELLVRLRDMLNGVYDPEAGHVEADALLLRYINDLEITAAFNALEKWYA